MTGYGMDDQVQFSAGSGFLSPSRPDPASYTMGMWGILPGDKAIGEWNLPLTIIYCSG